MSRVDVIVPCYNYGRFLGACVRSVLTQEGVEVRVLILDDASRDDSERVGRELAARDARVEYRRHAANRGHVETYNEGLAWSAGDYTLVLSADDLLIPGALRRAADVMDAHPEVGLTYGQAVVTDDPVRDEHRGLAVAGWKVIPGHGFIEDACRHACNRVPTPTAVVRTSVQHRIGGYRKELPHACDAEMWLRCAAHGAVGILGAYQAYYRLHSTNMSNGYWGLGDLRQRLLAFDALFKHYGGRIPGAARKRTLVTDFLSADAFAGAYRASEAGDGPLCKEYLGLAVMAKPVLRYRAGYWRLRVTLLLGRRCSSYLRPLYRHFRYGVSPRPDGSVATVAASNL